jgi:hypothetical protein
MAAALPRLLNPEISPAAAARCVLVLGTTRSGQVGAERSGSSRVLGECGLGLGSGGVVLLVFWRCRDGACWRAGMARNLLGPGLRLHEVGLGLTLVLLIPHFQHFQVIPSHVHPSYTKVRKKRTNNEKTATVHVNH